MADKKGSGFLDGLFFGGVLGGVLGLLFAPHTGSETRNNLKTKVDEFSENSDKVVGELKETSDKVLSQTKKVVETGLDNLSLAVAEAKKAAQAKKEELENEAKLNEEGA